MSDSASINSDELAGWDAELAAATSAEEIPASSTHSSVSTSSQRRASGPGNLMNTSSVARRLAADTPTERDLLVKKHAHDTTPPSLRLPTDDEDPAAVSAELADGSEAAASAAKSGSNASENSARSSDEMTAASIAPSGATSSRPSLNGPARKPQPRNGHMNRMNALDAFGDYIAHFFNKAEAYEEELERRQSRRNLMGEMDRPHHGISRRQLPISPEGDSSGSEDGDGVDGGADLEEEKEAPRQKKQEVAAKTQGEAVDEASRNEWRGRWKAFVGEKKKDKYAEVAIQSLDLPLGVDDFYRNVLDDNATHSFEKFMCDIGELNVNTTSWERTTDAADTDPSTRKIHYTHPVNAPMAPPTAKACKTQTVHKFGDIGVCVETCTVVEEVPMADCFVVEDRLWANEAPEGGCIVAVTFRIRFVKGTMFRRIIESTTRGEYESFWGQFGDMIRSLKGPTAVSFEEGEAAEEEALEEVATELEEAAAVMLDGERGQEVPLGSALSRIRQSSRKFTNAAKKVTGGETTARRSGADAVQEIASLILDGASYVRKLLSESGNAFALACGLFIFMFLVNVLALRQMMAMNDLIRNLDASLQKSNEFNKLLLLKLGGEGVCDGSG